MKGHQLLRLTLISWTFAACGGELEPELASTVEAVRPCLDCEGTFVCTSSVSEGALEQLPDTPALGVLNPGGDCSSQLVGIHASHDPTVFTAGADVSGCSPDPAVAVLVVDGQSSSVTLPCQP